MPKNYLQMFLELYGLGSTPTQFEPQPDGSGRAIAAWVKIARYLGKYGHFCGEIKKTLNSPLRKLLQKKLLYKVPAFFDVFEI